MNENLDLTNLQITEPIFKNVKFYVSGEVQSEVSNLTSNTKSINLYIQLIVLDRRSIEIRWSGAHELFHRLRDAFDMWSRTGRNRFAGCERSVRNTGRNTEMGLHVREIEETGEPEAVRLQSQQLVFEFGVLHFAIGTGLESCLEFGDLFRWKSEIEFGQELYASGDDGS